MPTNPDMAAKLAEALRKVKDVTGTSTLQWRIADEALAQYDAQRSGTAEREQAQVEAVARHCYGVMERRIVPLPPFEKVDHFVREWWLKCARAAIAALRASE
jgi:hypothetical protein